VYFNFSLQILTGQRCLFGRSKCPLEPRISVYSPRVSVVLCAGSGLARADHPPPPPTTELVLQILYRIKKLKEGPRHNKGLKNNNNNNNDSLQRRKFLCTLCGWNAPPLWSSDQSSWLQIRRPGFDFRHYQKKKKVVGLERVPLSLVSTTEELLDRKVAGSCLENREYVRRDPSR
jgi:hypothetical protein